MAGFTDYQRTHRLLIRSATRRKDKLRAAFFFSDDLSDKGGRLKTYFPAFNYYICILVYLWQTVYGKVPFIVSHNAEKSEVLQIQAISKFCP